MFDWMSAGPGPLDLTTPLAEGLRQGTAMAAQQEQVRSNYAREQEMSARLGLETKAQNFQESMWNSQADQRAAQLTLTQDQGKEAANQLNNVADDNSTMIQAKSALADAFSSGDAKALGNLPSFTFKTPQAQQAWDQTLNQAHQSNLGKTAAANLNMDLTAKASMAEDQLAQKKAVMGIPGADYNSFFDPGPNGTQVWNSGKAATAINDFSHSEDIFKSKNAASVYSAYAHGQSAENVANIRAQAYGTAAGLKASTGDYKTDIDSISKAEASGALTDKEADVQRAAARFRRDNPGQGGNASSVPGSVPASASNPVQGVQNLFQGLPTTGAPAAPIAPVGQPPPASGPSAVPATSQASAPSNSGEIFDGNAEHTNAAIARGAGRVWDTTSKTATGIWDLLDYTKDQ